MIGAAIAAGFLGGAAIGWLAAAAVGSLAIVWLLVVGRPISLATVVVVGGAIILGDWRGVPFPRIPQPTGLAEAQRITGVVVESPRIGSERQRFFLELERSETTAVDGCGQRVRVYVNAPRYPAVAPGDTIALSGEYTPERALPTGVAGYLAQHCAAGTYLGYTLRIDSTGSAWNRGLFQATTWLDRRFAARSPGDTGALLSGLVTGRDDALSDGRQKAFRATGTSHLTAVSGSNLALFVTIMSVSGRAWGLRHRRGWQVGLLVLLWAYAALTGGEAPVRRAALVATVAVLAWFVGRRADMITALLLSGAAMVAWQPMMLWSLSFQLSMAASAALAMIVQVDALDDRFNAVRSLLLANVAAQIATLPFAVGAFGQLPLLAIPTNLIVSPLAQIAFMLASLAGVIGAAGVLLPWLNAVCDAVIACAALAAGGILATVDWFGGFDQAVVPVRAGGLRILLVSVGCGIVVGLLGADGQRWLLRTLRDIVDGRRWIAIVGVFGAFVIVTVAMASR